MTQALSPIETAVVQQLEQYFQDLHGTPPSLVYNMVMQAVERPMLEVVLCRAGGNQLLASQMLGISRNTLRKRLQSHGILPATHLHASAKTRPANTR